MHNLLDRLPITTFTQHEDFSFQNINSQIENLTGIAALDWCRSGNSFWLLVHEADVERLRNHWQSAAQTGELATTSFRIRHARTGKVSHVLEHRQTRCNAAGAILSHEGVWLDITRQTMAERRLASAVWKETLSKLTLVLAHDFNNVLTGVLSLGRSSVDDAHELNPPGERLSLVQRSAMQASQLAREIIGLHHSKAGERTYQNLNDLISESVELVKKVFPRRITIAQQLAGRELFAYVDAVELRQIILDLAFNAADAMPDGGNLTVRTSRHEKWSHPKTFVGVEPKHPSLCIEIEDAGHGIAPRHLPLLFDPFFSTKSANQGSGLGLYNARLGLEKHHGGISVESVENHGAKFCLWLAEADFTETERAQPGKAAPRSLLLLGEGGPLLDSTAEFLRASNYQVVKAVSFDQAHDLLVSEENSFAALMVLADPEDGRWPNALRKIKQRYAELKIVLQITRETADKLGGKIANVGDLTIPHGMPESDILRQLATLLHDASHHD